MFLLGEGSLWVPHRLPRSRLSLGATWISLGVMWVPQTLTLVFGCVPQQNPSLWDIRV